jgi:hypothetical protein
MESDREQEILEALAALVIEGQRLIQQHSQLVAEFDRLKRELDEIREKRGASNATGLGGSVHKSLNKDLNAEETNLQPVHDKL